MTYAVPAVRLFVSPMRTHWCASRSFLNTMHPSLMDVTRPDITVGRARPLGGIDVLAELVGVGVDVHDCGGSLGSAQRVGIGLVADPEGVTA